MVKIKVSIPGVKFSYGDDYAVLDINGQEFEVSIELAKALEKALEEA